VFDEIECILSPLPASQVGGLTSSTWVVCLFPSEVTQDNRLFYSYAYQYSPKQQHTTDGTNSTFRTWAACMTLRQGEKLLIGLGFSITDYFLGNRHIYDKSGDLMRTREYGGRGRRRRSSYQKERKPLLAVVLRRGLLAISCTYNHITR